MDTDEREIPELPDGREAFTLGDQVCYLDPFEAAAEINRIAAATGGRDDFEHLRLFGEWLQRTQAWPALRPGQLNWLWQRVNVAIAEDRRVFLDRLRAASSTEPVSSA